MHYTFCVDYKALLILKLFRTAQLLCIMVINEALRGTIAEEILTIQLSSVI